MVTINTNSVANCYQAAAEIQNPMIQVQTIAQLKRLAIHGAKFALLLNYGLRSTKFIRYSPEEGKFTIKHYIDGSRERLTPQQLGKTLIGQAIRKGAFFKD